MKCPECNNELPAGAKFCNHCGAKIEKQGKTCPNPDCKRTGLPYEAVYCPDCGTELKFVPDQDSNIILMKIGENLTEIELFKNGHRDVSRTVDIGLNTFLDAIQDYMRRQHNMKVSMMMACNILMQVGAVCIGMDNPPADFTVSGPNSITSLPETDEISYMEIAYCLDKTLTLLTNELLILLEQMEPDLYNNIFGNGIYILEKDFHIRGIERYFSDRIGFPFKIKN